MFFPTNAIATGDYSPGTGGAPGTITAEGLPIVEFPTASGWDPDVAQIIMIVEGDGHEDGLPHRMMVTLEIDADGNGDADCEIRTASGDTEMQLHVTNSISGNVGSFDGTYGIYTIGGSVPLVTPKDTFYLTIESNGFMIGQDLPIEPPRPLPGFPQDRSAGVAAAPHAGRLAGGAQDVR